MLNKLTKTRQCTGRKTQGLRFNPAFYFQRLPSALQHSVLYASALILAKALGFIMVPFSTYYLSLEDYGRLDVLQTLADLMSIVIAMGLTETLYRYASGEANSTQTSQDSYSVDQKQAAANVFGLTLLIAIATLMLTQSFAKYFSLWLPGNIAVTEARLILASISLGGLVIIPLSWFRIRDKAWQFFYASAAMAILQVSFAVLLLVLGFGVTGVLSATLLAISLLAGYLIKVQLADTGIAFNFLLFKRYARYGGPLVFVGIAGFILGSFDRWILAASIGTASMASYALACKFGLLTAVLIQPFDLWWHAKRFAFIKGDNGPQLCAKYAGIGVIIALFSALLMSVLGPVLVRLLSPSEYHSAVNYIPYLAFLACLHSINNSLNLGMLNGETTWSVASVDAAAAVLALLGYFLLIPIYQAWGAILATAIALTSRVVICYIISQRYLFIPYRVKSLIVQSALTFIAIHWLSSPTWALKYFLLLTLLILLLVISAMWLRLIPRFFSADKQK
ncbi:MAG: oligosaccharide flippase family protein [Oceanospirillaceae bacterium]|nr:oligosaccharide flippase family protein [Oceanospirillaceae bacterium]